MATGIYKLSFNETSFVYIGQSINIEGRYASHISNMQNNKANYKLQAAYILFGTPILTILKECSEELLTKYELEYIDSYNSVNKGLNIINSDTPKNTLKGFIPKTSKYTEEVYLSALLEIIENPILSNLSIAKNVGVEIGVVTGIRNLSKYRWLKVRYPNEYSILEELYHNKKEPTASIDISYIPNPKVLVYYPILVSPEGLEYTIEKGTASTFAKAHNLNYTQLNRVLNGRIQHVVGWTVKNS